MAGRLTGKVALISGTAGGQGREAAIQFAAEGAKVVGCDVKAVEAEETVEIVRSAGGEMVSLQPVDLTDEDSVRAWIDFALDAYGDFDILYSNAAVAKTANLEDIRAKTGTGTSPTSSRWCSSRSSTQCPSSNVAAPG